VKEQDKDIINRIRRNMEKILSDEMIDRLCRIETRVAPDVVVETFIPNPLGRDIAQAQLDADAAYYEPLIQQAKAEVAEDIGGLVCCLAGNLMLEDKEAGALLAKQLQPLVDTIKLRYLPNLPRKEDCPELVNKQVERAKAEVARELIEEIKKVENPYSKYAAGDEHEVGFEACRLNIIKKMEEK